MVDLNVEYIGNELTATIDNETIPLKMYKIIKAPTTFICNESLDTPINTPINIDLFLGYEISNEDSIETIDEDMREFEDFILKKIKKGFINLKITSVSQQNQYYEKKYIFNDGQIIDSISLPLPIGDYLLIAEYMGNKYYEESNIIVNFSVTKRNAICVFESKDIQAYPNKPLQIGMTLIDEMNNKKISNCLLNYYFNGYEYVTQTNDQGYCNLNITTPNIDPNVCPLNTITINEDLNVAEEIEDGVYYYDDDGNIQYTDDITIFKNDIPDNLTNEQKTEIESILEADTLIDDNVEDGYENEENSEQTYTLVPIYPLEVDINSSIYNLVSETIINILLKTYTTDVNYTATNYDYRIHIDGDVVAYDDEDNLVNVEYGNVSFDISELTPHPIKTESVDENGHFSFDVEIVETESNNFTPDIFEFSAPIITNIELESLSGLSVTRNYALKHHITFKAKVTTNQIVIPYGMVTFVITKNYKEVYRYVTEVDKNGEAFFTFDVSTLGEYNIQAFYHKIFEYQSSESNILTYTIEDE